MVASREVPEPTAVSVNLALIQVPGDLILQQINLNLPMALPRLAAAVDEVACERKCKPQAGNNVGGFERVGSGFLLESEVPSKGGGDELRGAGPCADLEECANSRTAPHLLQRNVRQ